MARDMIGTKEFKKFVPLLVTLFLMVLFYNPAGSFFLTMNPVTGKVGFPIALTLVVYVVYHWVSIQKMGLGGYFKHMIPPGLPAWIVPFVFLLELITYFITRPLTLALRLFGNMFAGHMVIYLFVTGAFYFLLRGDGILLQALSVPTFLMAGVMVIFEIPGAVPAGLRLHPPRGQLHRRCGRRRPLIVGTPDLQLHSPPRTSPRDEPVADHRNTKEESSWKSPARFPSLVTVCPPSARPSPSV
uniref:F0F1 ATP synthase subunit A n=1 Tax=Janibacter limosus TaxID=53458 RepID=A0AC61U6X0_9MICO|nr:F0F1 ATP synthase subunit A [Janibacter limosus]